MKKLLLALTITALLSACATVADSPQYKDPCSQGQYFSATALGCRPYPLEQ